MNEDEFLKQTKALSGSVSPEGPRIFLPRLTEKLTYLQKREATPSGSVLLLGRNVVAKILDRQHIAEVSDHRIFLKLVEIRERHALFQFR